MGSGRVQDSKPSHSTTTTYSILILTCEPFEHGDVLETLEVVNEHVWDPEVIEELQGHGVPELRFHRVVGPDSEVEISDDDCGSNLIFI